MLNKKILVSGGSGVIGSSICIKLAENYDVIIGFKNSENLALKVLNQCNKKRKSNHQIINLGDLYTFRNNNKLPNNIDIFIHCAGFSDETKMSDIKTDQFQKKRN